MTYKCAICGNEYDRLLDRIECETECLAKQEEMEEQIKKAARDEAKLEAESNINKELDNLFAQYNKVAHMIYDYYEEYDHDLYDRVVNRSIPKNFFDFIF